MAFETGRKEKLDTFEKSAVIAVLVSFALVMLIAWGYSGHLLKSLSPSNQTSTADPQQIINTEKMRNEAESQIASSRSYFLLGSKTLFDDQNQAKTNLQKLISQFQAQNRNSEVETILLRIEGLLKQQEEIFDQAVNYRETGTESRIVGQFYQSKAAPIRDQINSNLNNISEIIKKQINQDRAAAEEAALAPQAEFPKALAWLTGLLSVLFLTLSGLVIRLIAKRRTQSLEKARLLSQAQKAILSRDELISSITHELTEPFAIISETTDVLRKRSDDPIALEAGEIIQSSVLIAKGAIKNLEDQSRKEDGVLTLRLEQQGLEGVFDEVKLAMHPFAKKKDIKLQFDAGNPPVLAFFDKDRVTRILQTLVSAAIRISPRNSRILVKTKSDQQFVHVSLTDSGHPGPEKDLAARWDSGWQEIGSDEKEPLVSLDIVKTMVEAHGGTIEVEHVGTGGSRFLFTLPRRRPVGAHVNKPGIGQLRPSVQNSRSSSDGPNP